MKEGVYIAAVSVLAVPLLCSAIYPFSYFWQGKKSEDAYDKLRNDVTASTGEAPTTTAPETTVPGETTEFIPDPNFMTDTKMMILWAGGAWRAPSWITR